MPKYKYQAVDLSNKKVKGQYIAVDDDDLKRILKSQNLYLLKYKKIPESSQMFGFLEKIKMDDFTLFCRQFAIMINAGLNIDKTLLLLKESTRNKKLKGILETSYSTSMFSYLLYSSRVSTLYLARPSTTTKWYFLYSGFVMMFKRRSE